MCEIQAGCYEEYNAGDLYFTVEYTEKGKVFGVDIIRPKGAESENRKYNILYRSETKYPRVPRVNLCPNVRVFNCLSN